MDKIVVNIFDDTCQHHVVNDGYFTSTEGRRPKDIQFVIKQMKFDGITLFTDSYILNPIVEQVKSKIKIAWCLESPAVHSIVHNNLHLVADRFDYIFCYREDLIKSHPHKFLPNSPGGSLIKDSNISLYSNLKNKKCSMILSGKRAFPGHILRHQIQRAAGTKSGIDFYGWGSSSGFIPDKIVALKEYMFHVVIENIISPYYFTEKLIDCLVTGCIPIYYGASNIDKYFNTEGFITFSSFEEFLKLKLTKEDFYKREKAIEENFKLAHNYLSSDDYLASKLTSLL